MEAWALFRRFRAAIFAIAAILSLAWTVLLSVYLARIWTQSTGLQHAAILAMLGVHFFSAIMLYLMIIVIFRFWLDFTRMLFLLAIHTGPTLFYMFQSSGYSCAIFSSRNTCNIARLVILINAWGIVGLFVIYTAVLLAMSRVPRPLPDRIEFPSDQKDADCSSAHISSITSETELLAEDSKEWRMPVEARARQSERYLPRLHSRRMHANHVGPYGAISVDSRPMPHIHVPLMRTPSVAITTSTTIPSTRPPSYSSIRGMYNSAQPGRPDSRQSNHRLTTAFTEPLRRQGTLDSVPSPLGTARTSDTRGSAFSRCPRWTTFTVEEYESSLGRRPSQAPPSGPLQKYPDVPARLQPGFMPISRSGTLHLYSRSVPALPYIDRPPLSARSPTIAGLPFSPARSPALAGLPMSPRMMPRAPPVTPSAQSVHSVHSLKPDLVFTRADTITQPPPSTHVRAASVPLPSPTGSAILDLYIESKPEDASMVNPYSLPLPSVIRREVSLESFESTASAYSADSAARDDQQWRESVMSAAHGNRR